MPELSQKGFYKSRKEEQSGQADNLLIKKFAETIALGSIGNVIVNPEDCRMVIEVKSTLTGTYLNEFNAEAQRVKKLILILFVGCLHTK